MLGPGQCVLPFEGTNSQPEELHSLGPTQQPAVELLSAS